MSGMFVVTAERWYLGTIIRFTLTDWRVQPPDRYVTINAEAVRWGDDGVGLRFLFQKPRRGEHNRAVPLFVDVTPRKLYEFLHASNQAQVRRTYETDPSATNPTSPIRDLKL